MCHALYIGSPLTLSEVRSMLPPGIAADLLPPADAAILRPHFSAAATFARLHVGTCSCAFFLAGGAAGAGRSRSDESELRRQWARMGLSRTGMIAALESHRRGSAARTATTAEWQQALASFVGEHARNAGPTLYFRHLTTTGLAGRPPAGHGPVVLPLARVLADPAGWLDEDRLTIVARVAG